MKNTFAILVLLLVSTRALSGVLFFHEESGIEINKTPSLQRVVSDGVRNTLEMKN